MPRSLELLQLAPFLPNWLQPSAPHCPAWLPFQGLTLAQGCLLQALWHFKPKLELTDGWTVGSPRVWSSSREKPQAQPSKSISKLISKYCCLLSRTGTSG